MVDFFIFSTSLIILLQGNQLLFFSYAFLGDLVQ